MTPNSKQRGLKRKKRVVPLGVNTSRHLLRMFKAMAKASGQRFGDFVVCSLLHKIFENARAFHVDPTKLDVSQEVCARLARRNRLLNEVLMIHRTGWPDKN